MKKTLAVLLVIVLLLAGCSNSEPSPPPEQEEPPVAYSQEPAEPEPVEQEPEIESEPEPVEPAQELPEDICEIVAAGRFSGEFDHWGEQSYTTYENPLLRLRYHIDEAEHQENLTLGVIPFDEPDVLFMARAFGTVLTMRLVEGSGHEWVRERVEADEERFVEMHREWLNYNVEAMGIDLEAYIAHMRHNRQINEESLAEHGFPPLERHFDTLEYADGEEIAFWPARHLVAGLYYQGYHINVIKPGAGSFWGYTYLYFQLDHDRAVVISIENYSLGEAGSREHIARFSLLED